MIISLCLDLISFMLNLKTIHSRENLDSKFDVILKTLKLTVQDPFTSQDFETYTKTKI